MTFAKSIFLLMGFVASNITYGQDLTPSSTNPPSSVNASIDQSIEQVLRDAGVLMQAGKSAQGYALLAPLEFERAGDSNFDYLLGIAALDSGKPDKATLAFERVLTVEPDHAAARLDMARAYFQLGDFTRAQSEFNIALNQTNDTLTRTTIKKYLDEISVRLAHPETSIEGYVQAAFGYDTNVNNSTAQTQINLPFLGNIPATLSPSNVKRADDYYGLGAGVEIIHPLNEAWNLYAAGDVSQRGYNKQNSFDAQAVAVRAGVLFGAQPHRLRLGLTAAQYDLSGARNRTTLGLDGEWHYALGPKNQLNAFAQAMNYRYADIALQANDFNQQVVGVGWTHGYADGQSLSSVSLYHGIEQDIANLITTATPVGGRVDGAKVFNGVRVTGQTLYDDALMLFVGAGSQLGNYGKVNNYFLVQRSDKQADITLGASWMFAPQWSLRPQLMYVRNNSNIVVYSYNRTDVSLTLRRDFK